ncbi:FRG domain-containing protein [Parapedobacter koreensis]|uniref:FRG domain-containing protein n=1 Tax=Parapedobacter koreensis TaxID=332977 RepID=A0A1H7NZ03_9SPHI|nr:FRG domain-containing protein [Parapedobacter koreensis]SEL28771.1 FRG domain-containing protein [Parapedobacter koreensis]
MEKEINSLVDYMLFIKALKQKYQVESMTRSFLYRGQATDTPLIPKILRLVPRNGDLLAIEQALLGEFKRANPLLIDPFQVKNDWDYLTLGQHYGLPTRFLDWTDNALAALWFATSSALAEERSGLYAVVWVFIAETGDFLPNTGDQHPFDVSESKLFRPRIIKQRINNQSGVFSVYSTEALKRKQRFEEMADYRAKMIKIKVPEAAVETMVDDLHSLGIDAFSIFPELEGLCAYLQWKFFNN